MKKILLNLAAFALLLASTQAADVVLWSNAITGSSSTNPYPITDSVFASNVTASDFSAGAGVTANAGGGRFNFSSWNSTGVDTTAYFSWTLAPSAGFAIDFTSLTGNWQASSTGPGSWSLRSSLDGFTSDLATGTIPKTGSAAAMNLSLAAASLNNVANQITFRLYAYGASAAGGTFSINDFAFNGAVISAIPEPHQYGIAMAGLLGVVIIVRRRQKAQKA